MKPLLPGQAAIARVHGRVRIVVCDHHEKLPIGEVFRETHGKLHQVTVQGVPVVALQFATVLKFEGKEQAYGGWINELEEHVLEDLATLAELPITLAGPDGKLVRETTEPNTMQRFAHFALPMISEVAGRKAWTPAHFAGAAAFIEAGGGQ